jgi:hypothetical protein
MLEWFVYPALKGASDFKVELYIMGVWRSAITIPGAWCVEILGT